MQVDNFSMFSQERVTELGQLRDAQKLVELVKLIYRHVRERRDSRGSEWRLDLSAASEPLLREDEAARYALIAHSFRVYFFMDERDGASSSSSSAAASVGGDQIDFERARAGDSFALAMIACVVLMNGFALELEPFQSACDLATQEQSIYSTFEVFMNNLERLHVTNPPRHYAIFAEFVGMSDHTRKSLSKELHPRHASNNLHHHHHHQQSHAPQMNRSELLCVTPHRASSNHHRHGATSAGASNNGNHNGASASSSSSSSLSATASSSLMAGLMSPMQRATLNSPARRRDEELHTLRQERAALERQVRADRHELDDVAFDLAESRRECVELRAKLDDLQRRCTELGKYKERADECDSALEREAHDKRVIHALEERLAKCRGDLDELVVLRRERADQETKAASALGEADRAHAQLQAQVSELKRLREVEAHVVRLEANCLEKERTINMHIAQVCCSCCCF